MSNKPTGQVEAVGHFLKLLRVAVGNCSSLETPLGEDEWNAVCVLAKKQSVLGIIYAAAMSLPQEQIPPLRPKIKLALTAEKILEQNAVSRTHVAQVMGSLSSLGLNGVLLKGQGAAALYPDPGLRQSGDIDIWINEPRQAVLNKVAPGWKIGRVCYHHADLAVFDDGTDVEIHFYPTWFNSPLKNRRLQKWFANHYDECLRNVNPDLSCAVTTVSFDCVFSLVHIYRHLLFEGIGLRQLMDYYYILRHSTAGERAGAYEFLCGLGMKRFVAAAMYALDHFFALPREYMLCEMDARWGSFFVDEIMRSGNFGHYDRRNRRGDGLLALVSSRLGRLPRFFCLAPSEVLWAPVFKTWQFVWRLLNNYR